MLDHVTLTALDIRSALAFYDTALGALGYARVAELVDEEEDDAAVEAVGFGLPGGAAQLWVVAGTAPTTGVHVRFRAAERTAVAAFHERALAAGGQEHSAPRRWPISRRGEFNAIVRDPAGNLIEVVAPE
jgi:catechol 2,3-dioxygenase-like lactoylglutathione lyase family enzyme